MKIFLQMINPSETCAINVKSVALLAAFWLFFPGCESVSAQSVRGSSEKPNIIYILADDLGYGDLGSYGQEQIHTPNLDQMAEEGVRFTQHYAGSTVCAPSRSVLMTGLHSGHTPIRGNKEIMPIGQYPLPFSTVTLPKLLKKAGYVTGGFGKWGLGYPGSEGLPSYQGFDEFFGYLGQRRSHFFYPEFLFHDIAGRGLERVPLEGNKVENASRPGFERPGAGPPVTRGQYSQDVIIREALSFIDAHKEESFFLYVPSQIPHASLTVPEEEMKIYLDEQGNSIFPEDTTYSAGGYTKQPKPAATYAAMVTRLDRYVGLILEKLDEAGLAEKTLVMFASDNGSYTEGGYHYSMHNSNAPFRGGKRDMYEGGIRVPMIARWTGEVEAGRVSDHISGFQDILPTLAELAGITPPPNIDGISMVPALLGEGSQDQHEYLYWEFPAQGGKQAVRWGKWKAVRLDVTKNPNAPLELYNLDEDISEQKNLADQHPYVVKEIEQIMEKAHVPSEIFPLFELNTIRTD